MHIWKHRHRLVQHNVMPYSSSMKALSETQAAPGSRAPGARVLAGAAHICHPLLWEKGREREDERGAEAAKEKETRRVADEETAASMRKGRKEVHLPTLFLLILHSNLSTKAGAAVDAAAVGS